MFCFFKKNRTQENSLSSDYFFHPIQMICPLSSNSYQSFKTKAFVLFGTWTFKFEEIINSQWLVACCHDIYVDNNYLFLLVQFPCTEVKNCRMLFIAFLAKAHLIGTKVLKPLKMGTKWSLQPEMQCQASKEMDP